MKPIVAFSIFTLFSTSAAFSQTDFLERQAQRAKDKIVQRAENKIDEGVDKALDETENGIEESVKGSEKKSEKSDKKSKNGSSEQNESSSSGTSEKTTSKNNESSSSSAKSDLKTYSKYDFVAGEKIIGFETFEETELGDFPLGWNTNSSGQISKIGTSEEKWMQINQDGYFSPEFITNIPENFTLEFDVFTRYVNSNILSYGFEICAVESPRKNIGNEVYSTKAGFEYKWSTCKSSNYYNVYENGEVTNSNDQLSNNDLICEGSDYDIPSTVHFSIWRQKNRLRIYINQNKILDIPYGLPIEYNYNLFRFTSNYMNYFEQENKDEFMVANIKYAVGAPDTRSKLITDGKLVSRGILFNVNSDQIKAESYGTLKEIAKVLEENPSVKIQIVGHTDSDGDEKLNLELSKKRAESVKQALTNDFNISSDRMTVDGKGESEPTDPNSSPSGKANNRRVEFIKL